MSVLGVRLPQWVGALGRFGVSALVLWGLFATGAIDPAGFVGALKSPFSFLLAVICLFLATLLAAERWRILLGHYGSHYRWLPLCAVNGFASLAASILPGAAAAEALRMVWVMRNTAGSRTGPMFSVIIDKLLALYGLMTLGALSMLIRPALFMARPSLAILTSVLTAVMIGFPLGLALFGMVERRFALLSRVQPWSQAGRIQALVFSVLTAIAVYSRGPALLLRALIVSLASALLMASSIWLLVPADFPSALGLPDYVVALGAGMVANIVPITPGGLGVGEGGFTLICHLLETSPVSAAFGTIFLAYRIAGIAALLPFALVPLFARRLTGQPKVALPG